VAQLISIFLMGASMSDQKSFGALFWSGHVSTYIRGQNQSGVQPAMGQTTGNPVRSESLIRKVARGIREIFSEIAAGFPSSTMAQTARTSISLAFVLLAQLGPFLAAVFISRSAAKVFDYKRLARAENLNPFLWQRAVAFARYAIEPFEPRPDAE